MQMLKHIGLFMKNNMMQLQRKWYALPLLLLFPIIVISMLAFIMISFFNAEEQEIIHVGLVDLDETRETQMVMNVMEDSKEFANFITVEQMSESVAEQEIKQNNLSAYIIFPENFANLLYTGDSVELEIIGNEKQRTESHFVKSFMNSISEHINSAQASILTINDYIKKLDFTDSERHDILLEQFQSFLLFTLTKDRVIVEESIENKTSETPFAYYVISSWVIITTIWLFVFYNFLHTDTSLRMERRIRLYNVTIFQQLISKLLVSFFMTLLFSIGFFIAIYFVLDTTLYSSDFWDIAIRASLYIGSLLFIIAILELIVRSQKLLLVLQSIGIFIAIVLSGAIIPTIYFPLFLQQTIEKLFSFEYFNHLKDLLLKREFLDEPIILIITCISSFAIMAIIAFWKERIRQ